MNDNRSQLNDGKHNAALVHGGEPYRWVIVLVLLFAVTTAFFDRINIAVLFANRDFKDAIGVGNNPALLGLLMSAFVFAYGVSAMLLSISSDFAGPRRTLSAIALTLAVVMGFMGGVSTYAAMFAGRVLLGLAEGPQFGTANVAVRQWFRPGERGFATSLWSVGSPIGSMIGFPVIIMLVATYGWRASFYLLAALNGFVALPVVWFLLRDRAAAKPATPAVEQSFKAAISTLFSTRAFWLLAVYDCGAMIYLWGFNSWLPAYLQEARHFDVKHSSMFSSLPFLLMILGSLGGGWIGDRFRCKAYVCLVGLLAAGLLIVPAVNAHDAYASAVFLALSAGAWGATVPPLFALGTEIIPARVTSMGFGLYAGFANIVGALAPYAMGLAIGKRGNYGMALLIITVSCALLSMAMVPLLRRDRPRNSGGIIGDIASVRQA